MLGQGEGAIIGGGRRDGEEYIPEEAGAQLVERDTSRTALGIEDTDLLLHMAETADKRADAYKKIKLAALRLTSADDWVDQGGNPYLLAPGAEKVADIFGSPGALRVRSRRRRRARAATSS